MTDVSTAITAATGMAICPEWILGSASGDDTLVVSANGLKTLVFVASAHDSSYFQIYSMTQYAGYPVPYSTPWGTVSGGSYVIAPDGTFKNEETWSGISTSVAGYYSRSSASTLSIYVDFRNFGFLVVSGDSMHFIPYDVADFDDEMYARVK